MRDEGDADEIAAPSPDKSTTNIMRRGRGVLVRHATSFSLILFVAHAHCHLIILYFQQDKSNRPASQGSSRANVKPPRRRSSRLCQGQDEPRSVLETATLPPAEPRTLKRGRGRSVPAVRPAKKPRGSSGAGVNDGRRVTRSRSADDALASASNKTTLPVPTKKAAQNHIKPILRPKEKATAVATFHGCLPQDNFMDTDDYSLNPPSYDPCKFTFDIAPHDLRTANDILEVPEFVTDIYQRLFQAEASSILCWCIVHRTLPISFSSLNCCFPTDSFSCAIVFRCTSSHYSRHAHYTDRLACAVAVEAPLLA
jgi:hypothetical protein